MMVHKLILSRQTSPIGDFLLVCDMNGILVASEYADHLPRLHRLLSRRLGHYHLSEGAAVISISQALKAYFDGDITAIDTIPVTFNGSDFQNKAWAALRQIPAGETASYCEQAARIGNKKAARAVGSANHNNPYNLIVPCHRVIGTNGNLVGYAGGLERKRWLLEHEKRYANPPMHLKIQSE
ncbi:MAG: methylated-DNA--[protein]-cysteine S-methyltransferase [Asticcacaulis sp.]